MPKAHRYPLIELQEVIIDKIKSDSYFQSILPRDIDNNIVIYDKSIEEIKNFQCPACAVTTDWEFGRTKQQNGLSTRTPNIKIQWAEEGSDTFEIRKKVYQRCEDLIYTIEKDRTLEGLVSFFYVDNFKWLGERRNSLGLLQGYEMTLSIALI